MSFSGNISAPLSKSLLVSARGMDAQGARFLAISQNLANASTRPTAPGQMPYRRKLVSYTNRLDFKKGINLIHLKPMQFDKSPFKSVYDPTDPAADAKGYVQESNVKPLIEMADMREAGLTYDANLKAYEHSLGMLNNTIGLLRAT